MLCNSANCWIDDVNKPCARAVRIASGSTSPRGRTPRVYDGATLHSATLHLCSVGQNPETVQAKRACCYTAGWSTCNQVPDTSRRTRNQAGFCRRVTCLQRVILVPVGLQRDVTDCWWTMSSDGTLGETPAQRPPEACPAGRILGRVRGITAAAEPRRAAPNARGRSPRALALRRPRGR